MSDANPSRPLAPASPAHEARAAGDLVDDLLHVLGGGLVAAAPAAVGAPLWACAAPGLVAGLIRELEQMRRDGDFDFGWSRARDVAGWLAGALIAGLAL
jgi:hypothetical protein